MSLRNASSPDPAAEKGDRFAEVAEVCHIGTSPEHQQEVPACA
jgi:hypothetical protein